MQPHTDDPFPLHRVEPVVLLVAPTEDLDPSIEEAVRSSGLTVDVATDVATAQRRLAEVSGRTPSAVIMTDSSRQSSRELAVRVGATGVLPGPGELLVWAVDAAPVAGRSTSFNWLINRSAGPADVVAAVAAAVRRSRAWKHEAARIIDVRITGREALQAIDGAETLLEAFRRLVLAITRTVSGSTAAVVVGDRVVASLTGIHADTVGVTARSTIRLPFEIIGRRIATLVVGLDHEDQDEIVFVTAALTDLLAAATPRLAAFDWATGSRRESPDWQRLVERAEFLPVFHPVADLATGDHVAYAAQTRLFCGLRTDVALRKAKGAGWHHELERAMFLQACARGAALPAAAGFTVRATSGLIVSGVLDELPPGRPIGIELSEIEALLDPRAMAAAIEAIRPNHRAVIVEVGLATVGAGQLPPLAVDAVKLAPGLAAEIEARPAEQSMIADIVVAARDRGARVIATGVDEIDAVPTLTALGVEQGLGFAVGEPGEALDLTMASSVLHALPSVT